MVRQWLMQEGPTQAMQPPSDTGLVPSNRSNSLLRWNATLAVAHAHQEGVILAISFTRDPIVATPTVSSYLFDPAIGSLVPGQRTLFDP
jgi:hypothetical protein